MFLLTIAALSFAALLVIILPGAVLVMALLVNLRPSPSQPGDGESGTTRETERQMSEVVTLGHSYLSPSGALWEGPVESP
jgi:hypothetical protein